MQSGAQYVMTSGALKMLKWCADSWDINQQVCIKCVLLHTSRCFQGLMDPRSGERACNYAYACRDGEMLVVTKNRTFPFSKACPNPPQKGPKPLAKLYNLPTNLRTL